MKANKNLVSLSIVGVVTTIVAFCAGYFFGDLSHSQAAATLTSKSHDRSVHTQPDRMSVLARSGRSDALVDVSDLEDLVRFKSHFERTFALNELLQGGTMDSLQVNLEQSKSIDSTNLRKSVHQAIFQRMATLNPSRHWSRFTRCRLRTDHYCCRPYLKSGLWPIWSRQSKKLRAWTA